MLEIWCRNSRHESKAKCIAVVSNMEALRERTTSSEDFSKFKVDELKNYLRERGIQLDGGKGKQKAELLDLCKKAAAMNNLLNLPSNC